MNQIHSTSKCASVIVWMLVVTGVFAEEQTESVSSPVVLAHGKAPGEVRDDNGMKMKLVWCPPGKFPMGDVVEPVGTRRIDPVRVTLTKGFWIGRFEVTQMEWQAVMQSAPWKDRDFTKQGDDFPATYIDWASASKFCKLLSDRERSTGRLPDHWEYRLPTEAQWERACRAGTEEEFSFGKDGRDFGEYGWSGDTRDGNDAFAHRVGQKKPNPWGLYDMHGNVWEWCQDWYAPKLPGGVDPLVTDEIPDDARRVIRGGGWGCAILHCRSGYHFAQNPRIDSSEYGFRVVLCPSP